MSGDGPIILTGADRSGTTLLYALLASHSHVSMVRRTNMWRWFYDGYGDLSDPANLADCLDTMMRYARLGVLQLDPERIRAEFAGRPQTYGQLFGVMHEQHAARRQRPRWGDKSLHTEHFAQEIFAELPEARILHMVRDPRDRYASIIRRYETDGRPAKGIGAAMGRWRSSVRVGVANVEEFGDHRYRMVRYETLATSPEETLREVCAFIGEPYESEMLAMGGVTDAADYSGNSSFESIAPGEISTRSIGRFRRALDARTIAAIEAIGGKWMEVFDYPSADPALSGFERVRFWASDLPLEAVRTAGWLARNRNGGERNRAVPEHRLLDGSTDVNIT